MKKTYQQKKDEKKLQKAVSNTTGIKCKHPDCERMLSHAELYFSLYCFKHQLISRKQSK
jgi:hypothetical protein